MRILVTGATGKVGRAVTKQLANSGLPTIAASRSATKAKAQLGLEEQIEYIDFDFHQPASFANTLDGKSHLFLIAPPAAKEAELLIQFIHQAQAHKIDHITLLSGRTTGDLKGRTLNKLESVLENDQALDHYEVADILSSTPYTILRAGWFMQNFDTWHQSDIRDENGIFLLARALAWHARGPGFESPYLHFSTSTN